MKNQIVNYVNRSVSEIKDFKSTLFNTAKENQYYDVVAGEVSGCLVAADDDYPLAVLKNILRLITDWGFLESYYTYECCRKVYSILKNLINHIFELPAYPDDKICQAFNLLNSFWGYQLNDRWQMDMDFRFAFIKEKYIDKIITYCPGILSEKKIEMILWFLENAYKRYPRQKIIADHKLLQNPLLERLFKTLRPIIVFCISILECSEYAHLHHRLRHIIQKYNKLVTGLPIPSVGIVEANMALKNIKRVSAILSILHDIFNTSGTSIFIMAQYLGFEPYFHNLQDADIIFFVGGAVKEKKPILEYKQSWQATMQSLLENINHFERFILIFSRLDLQQQKLALLWRFHDRTLLNMVVDARLKNFLQTKEKAEYSRDRSRLLSSHIQENSINRVLSLSLRG